MLTLRNHCNIRPETHVLCIWDRMNTVFIPHILSVARLDQQWSLRSLSLKFEYIAQTENTLMITIFMLRNDMHVRYVYLGAYRPWNSFYELGSLFSNERVMPLFKSCDLVLPIIDSSFHSGYRYPEAWGQCLPHRQIRFHHRMSIHMYHQRCRKEILGSNASEVGMEMKPEFPPMLWATHPVVVRVIALTRSFNRL